MTTALSVAQLLSKKFWIFDLDGTLTQPLHDFAAIRTSLGIPASSGILEYIQQQPEPLRSRLNEQLTAIEIDVAERTKPMPYACDLIQGLHHQGIELAILTRNRRDCVDIVLQRLGLTQCFAAQQIIASECAEPKPSPAGIDRLIAQWQCRLSQCVMVGDYLYDLQAGRAAGVDTVHFNPCLGDVWPEQTDLLLTSFEPVVNGLTE
ncbi:MAG: HAD-IA family hydrolase [Motiliproteus sp.]